MSGMERDGAASARELVSELYRRPGFLLRRAHQISVSLFLSEVAPLPITTTQYGAMVVLSAYHSLDHVGLAKLLGTDRSTITLVVGNLIEMGYVLRKSDPKDKRRKVLELSDAGRKVLEKLEPSARRAAKRALEPFTAKDGKQFIELLTRFVSTFNAEARAPIMAGDPGRRRSRPTVD